MTLLVMDLKLPDGATLHDADDVARAVMALRPHFEAWPEWRSARCAGVTAPAERSFRTPARDV
jgi:hypothetical protein